MSIGFDGFGRWFLMGFDDMNEIDNDGPERNAVH